MSSILNSCTYSQSSSVSNLIVSDQKVAPYHMIAFKLTTPKSDFLLIGTG